MKKPLAEFCGTALLLLSVTGSGIYGETLAAGNTAVALLANSIATGCALYVLITLIGPISGAHFNPLVSLYSLAQKRMLKSDCAAYIAAQFCGGVAGVWLTHLMYAQPVLQFSAKVRSGPAQWLSEFVAALLLLLAIHLALRCAKERIPMLVALLVTGGYWFTSSTFFANPAVTFARMFTDTFVGIRPADAPGFMFAQLAALLLVIPLVRISIYRPAE